MLCQVGMIQVPSIQERRFSVIWQDDRNTLAPIVKQVRSALGRGRHPKEGPTAQDTATAKYRACRSQGKPLHAPLDHCNPPSITALGSPVPLVFPARRRFRGGHERWLLALAMFRLGMTARRRWERQRRCGVDRSILKEWLTDAYVLEQVTEMKIEILTKQLSQHHNFVLPLTLWDNVALRTRFLERHRDVCVVWIWERPSKSDVSAPPLKHGHRLATHDIVHSFPNGLKAKSSPGRLPNS